MSEAYENYLDDLNSASIEAYSTKITTEKIIELLTLYPEMSLSNIINNPDSLGNAIIEKLTELEAIKEAAKDFIEACKRERAPILDLSENFRLSYVNFKDLVNETEQNL